MCDLLVGKPDIPVGYPRIKTSTLQRNSSWDGRFVGSGEGKAADTTTPPAAEARSPGMCGRTVAAGQQQDTSEQQQPPKTPTIMDAAIRCTAPNCTCEGFSPSKPYIRSCSTCNHGWVAHALDKLGFRHLFSSNSQVEVVQRSAAFDVASLMLYGAEAMPIRLKILLDRLFSVLHRDEVVHVLHGFGWTYEDYARGYIIQDTRGQVLDRWTMPSREEEPLILQQFLRFGETKPIAQQLLLQESSERMEQVLQQGESDIKRFIQRTSRLAATTLPPVSCSSARLPPSAKPASSVSSTTSLSPVTRSPLNSPLSSSPLNKLQNMQPYDYRRERNHSPDIQNQFPPTPLPTSPTTAAPSPFFSSNPPPPEAFDATNSSQACTSDFSMTDEGSDSEAMNLSRQPQSLPMGGHLDSIYAAKKVRHLRKSANPMKRRWNPLMLSGLATNPSTGKKRVQCHVCLKTFCDKGALKIHFSAVHLREMHKCTVDGCNMMFSSRRSRNRHSANPNPKLHTPNLRRKLSHHDGRSSLPFPLIPPSSLMGFSNGKSSSNNHLLQPLPPPPLPTEGLPTIKTETNHLPSSTMDEQGEPGGSSSQPNHLSSSFWKPSEEALALTTKKPRLELMNNGGDVSNDGDEGIDLSMKDQQQQNGTSSSASKGVSKRKSFNPTKCAMTTAANSDDDLQYVSTDDGSSSDTFVDGDFSSDVDLDSKDDDTCSMPVPNLRTPPKPAAEDKSAAVRSPGSMMTMPRFQPDVSSLDLSVKNKEPANHESEEVMESPLRYLETLSLGAFTGLLNHTKSTFSQHIASTTGISYHAPGLGLASTPNHLPEPPRERRSSSLVDSTPLPIPIPSSGGSLQDSDPDGQMSLLPVYRDASMIGAVDVPVDKENPRRCIACGKIFQNHFGVKTHYQNVHLKLMHKCTVEGCNAAFPSKRSRDRHSANLNLHRKLLSTSADKGHFFDKGGVFPYPHPGVAFRDDYFSRLYDPSMPLNLYHARFGEGFLPSPPFSSPLGPTGPLGVMNPFHPAFMVPTTSGSSLHEGGTRISDDTPISSISSTPSPRPKSSSPSSFSPDKEDQRRPSLALDTDPTPDPEGRFVCRFCQRLFVDAAHLRDHYEGTHLPNLLPCPAEGCHKVFLTAPDRDAHCEAEGHVTKRDNKTPPES